MYLDNLVGLGIKKPLLCFLILESEGITLWIRTQHGQRALFVSIAHPPSQLVHRSLGRLAYAEMKTAEYHIKQSHDNPERFYIWGLSLMITPT